MSAASPTPMGAGSHFTSLGRRTSARQALRRPTSRAHVARSESQPIASSARDVAHSTIAHGAQSQSQQYDGMHDSSDDEIPVPMKLSALTKALLNDGGASDAAPQRQPSPGGQQQHQPEPRMMTRRRSYLARSASSAPDDVPAPEAERPVRETRRHVRAGSASVPSAVPSTRPSSPARARDSSPAPRKRIVRLSTTPGGGPVSSSGLRRSLSASSRRRPDSRNGNTDEGIQSTNAPAAAEEADVNTPAQPVRRVQIAVGSSAQRRSIGGSSSGMGSRLSGSGFRSDHEAPEEPRTESRPQSAMNQSSVSRFGGGSIRAAESQNPQSSIRVKRLGKVAGSFLSGPARRGRRRESEEDRLARENGDGDFLSAQEQDEHQLLVRDQADPEPVPSYRDFATSGSPVSSKELRAGSRRQSYADLRAASRQEIRQELQQKEEFETAHEELAQPRSEIPSQQEQENEVPAPSAFQRRKFSVSSIHEKDRMDRKLLRSPSLIEIGSRPVHRAVSPERPILATISQNVQKTPHVVIPMQRPAPPPPPKMSVLDAATATAGAATTSQANKKKSIILKVNGRSYQRVDCIGRGGSAKVYRVTAENGKMFALKRVNIENADENTVKGYKGEINLLQKLSKVERVIQLYDFELNEEKHLLSLVSCVSSRPLTLISVY